MLEASNQDTLMTADELAEWQSKLYAWQTWLSESTEYKRTHAEPSLDIELEQPSLAEREEYERTE